MDNLNTRTVERLIDCTFVKCSMLDLKSGDVFRMFEHDGSPVLAESSVQAVFIADCDGFVDESTGLHCIKVKNCKE